MLVRFWTISLTDSTNRTHYATHNDAIQTIINTWSATKDQPLIKRLNMADNTQCYGIFDKATGKSMGHITENSFFIKQKPDGLRPPEENQ